jgi:hypothetical protein
MCSGTSTPSEPRWIRPSPLKVVRDEAVIISEEPTVKTCISVLYVLLHSRIMKNYNWMCCIHTSSFTGFACVWFRYIGISLHCTYQNLVLCSWVWLLMHMYVVPLWFGNSGIIFFFQTGYLYLFCIWSSVNCYVMEVELFWRSVFLHYSACLNKKV